MSEGRDHAWRDGRLAGLDPADLAERFGTPAHVCDLDAVGERADALRAALPGACDLAYAVKANPNLAVLRHLAGRGLGADVASGGELRHALRAGFDPARVVFTGPGKRDDELAAAVAAGVRAVTVESPGELRRLAAIAEVLGRRQPVLLRAAGVADGPVPGPSGAGGDEVRLAGDDAGGAAGKFGMDPADLRAAAAEAAASPWLEPLGLHAFSLSNVTDADTIGDHAEATVDAARALASGAGFALRLVDVGGGLGIAYADGGPGLDLARLGARLAALRARMDADPACRGARLLLEPGRYLVGPAGAYLTRVVDLKRLGGRPVAIVDGGIHHVLRPALVGQRHRLRVLTGAGAEPARAEGAGAGPAREGPAGGDRLAVTVAGPLCTGLDVLGEVSVAAPPAPGDLIALLDVGAYGATESMPLFLSHPMPPEIAVRGGVAWAAAPRVDPDEWLGRQAGEPGPA